MRGAPLNKCVHDKQIYEYNKKMGLNNYMDPFTKLFCVYLDNSPKMDYFYNQKTEVSPDDTTKFNLLRNKKGFQVAMFSSADSDSRISSQENYKMGDLMSAKLDINSTTIIYRGFPFPKPNVNGICDNL